MALTKKQQKTLDDVEKQISTSRTSWLAAYDQAKANGSVVMEPGSTLKLLWDQLVTLREKRNDLLAQYRASGNTL
jgi:hypothetical protein